MKLFLCSIVAAILWQVGQWKGIAALADLSFPTSTHSSFGKPHYIGEYFDEIGYYQALRVADTRPLVRKQSAFQLIEVFENDHYGKILVLDGVLQLTERDADAYNEMMAHVPMFQNREPKRVLVIGGGDGYVVSEVLKHESVVLVDHVDLDGEVIETCRQHFSWGKQVWEDNADRVQLHLLDGALFVEQAKDGFYDVIIQDSSDPWAWNEEGEKYALPSSVLYSKRHLMNLHRILAPGGVLSFQAESLQIPSDLQDIARWRQDALQVGFREARYGSITISSYPTGQIGFLLCEKSLPAPGLYQQVKERYEKMIDQEGGATTYYHPRLQSSAFDIPLWAEQAIYGPNGISNHVCLQNDWNNESSPSIEG